MVKKRKGVKFIFAESDPDKIIVSMIEWKGFVYVATQKGVYRIEEGDKLVRLELVEKKQFKAKECQDETNKRSNPL